MVDTADDWHPVFFFKFSVVRKITGTKLCLGILLVRVPAFPVSTSFEFLITICVTAQMEEKYVAQKCLK